LLPPSPCRSCFIPTALLGFTLRSVPLPGGFAGVTANQAPTCRFSRRDTQCETPGQNDGPRLLGFHPPASPWHPNMGLARRLLDAPVGFSPSRVSRSKTLPDSRPASSHALPGTRKRTPANQRRPRVSIGLRLARPPNVTGVWNERTSNPSRVSAPAAIRLIREPRRPGYEFT
jgi:hypothetical protein